MKIMASVLIAMAMGVWIMSGLLLYTLWPYILTFVVVFFIVKKGIQYHREQEQHNKNPQSSDITDPERWFL